MKRIIILLITLFLCVISNSQILFNTGNEELDADLVMINANAKLDFEAFKTNLEISYNISVKKIDYLSINLKMEPILLPLQPSL